MKRPLDNRYDLEGVGILRTFRLAVLARLVPLGNWRGGPGLRCLLVLGTLHSVGNILYLLRNRYGHRLGPIKRILARLHRR